MEASVDGQTVSRPIRPAATVQPTGAKTANCKWTKTKRKKEACALSWETRSAERVSGFFFLAMDVLFPFYERNPTSSCHSASLQFLHRLSVALSLSLSPSWLKCPA